MKKIVALVLSLVMALSLCTVAFGAIKGTYSTAELEKVKGKSSKGAGFVTYYVDKDSNVFIPCDKDDADYRLTDKNGAFQMYLKEGTKADATYTCELKVQKATKDAASCTKDHFIVDGYVNSDGDFFVKDVDHSDFNALVNGVVVPVRAATVAVWGGSDGEVVYAYHVLAKAVANDKTGYDEAKCLICGATVALTNDESVMKAAKVKYSELFQYDPDLAYAVADDNKWEGKYDFNYAQDGVDDYAFAWVLTGGSKAGTKDGVNSAKTFDAGIAMYVGMSLLSVAGGAVVIGKKKEF